MRIVHVATTACAGATEALSSAIRDHTEHDSRVINNGGHVNNLVFPHDATWASTEQFPLLARADVIVMHNGGGEECLNDRSEPVCDYLLGDGAKKAVYFFHSHPEMPKMEFGLEALARGEKIFCPAQYQALLWARRAFGLGKDPKARPQAPCAVRNVIRYDRSDFPHRKERADGKVRIGFAPTFRQDQKDQEPGSVAWYHSKGYGVTKEILEEVSKAKHVEHVIIEGLPYDMAIRVKAECDIFIEELVTGSYHRCALEGLALGIPTLVNIEPAILGIATRSAGADDFPGIQTTIDQLKERLEWLIGMKKKARKKLGDSSKDWMKRYWHPRDIAQGFCKELEKLPSYAEHL
jgi:hypothetical protein